jgi:hypothetical protein
MGTRAQLADFIGGSQPRNARICSVRSDSSSGGCQVGSVAHLVAKDPGGLVAMSRGGDRGRVHTWDGQEAVSQVPCWRQQRPDGAAVGLAAAGPNRPPSTSHTTSLSRWGSAPAEPLSQAAGISPCGCGTWPLTQPVLSWFCRSASWSCGQLPIDADGADLLPSCLPAVPVGLLANRCGSRSSVDAHGPCLRLPLHCQACQRSLTRSEACHLAGGDELCQEMPSAR